MASAGLPSRRKLIPHTERPVKPDKDTGCAVCRRPGCRLQSHQTYQTPRRHTTKELNNTPKARSDTQSTRSAKTPYTSSYAFTQGAAPSIDPYGINSGRLDGFHELPVPGGHRSELHHAVYSVLNFKMGAATAFPLPAGLAVNDIGGAMIVPVMMDTSLCLSVLAAWEAVQCLSGQKSSDLTYLSYEAQAFQSLRTQLMEKGQAGLSDEAVMASALLWATSTLFAQAESLRRHAAGVKAMVRARGGLDKLGHAGAIKQLILWADFLTAQFLNEDVCFRDIGEAATIPASLLQLRKSIAITEPFDELLPDTIKAATDLRLLLSSHDRALKTGHVSIPEYKALMSILNKSTIHRLGLAKQYQDEKHSIDECVITAMNLLRLTVLFHAGPLYAIVVSVIDRLRRLASRDGLDLWVDCIDILIWACFVGLVNQFDTHNRFHFTEMISKALTVKFESGWPDDWQTDILTMLRSFLWSDTVLTELYFEMCQSIESHIISPGSILP